MIGDVVGDGDVNETEVVAVNDHVNVMPELDGFEACRRIRESPEWREIPIIFLTAKTETSDVVKGFELGAVDYVAKPFNAHELLARVNTHLTLDQLRRAVAGKNEELARAHQLVRRAFGRYVSEEVAESLLSTPEALDLGGEEREVSILMSDLRGFTALTARLGPHEVIEFLNVYLEAMVEVIGRHRGTIDEIIGDGIMVFFGAPVSQADHAERAVACGLAMHIAMADINPRLVERGLPELEMGVGVHTGRVVVGNIGSLRRTKYAAVGVNVSLAGRIESFTTGGQLLISESTRNAVKTPLRIDGQFDVEPKGASHAMRLFEIGGMGAPFDLSLPLRPSAIRRLSQPLAVRFVVLEEKFLGRTVHQGRLVALSETEACLETDLAVLPHSNLRIDVDALEGEVPVREIYAKAAPAEESPRQCRLRFTSVSPDLKVWMRSAAAKAR